MKRREARIARKNQKQIRESGKKARLIETVSTSDTPRTLLDLEATKSVRVIAEPDSFMQSRMALKLFEYADREGEWSWGQKRNWCLQAIQDGTDCTIRTTMNQMSNLKWSEILAQNTGEKKRRKKHHPQPWDSICPEAQGRWIEINRYEEEIFRFRVGGKQRIWGVRHGATFFVVWWDSEHQIYPTEKD
jgi:hypothetical protein